MNGGYVMVDATGLDVSTESFSETLPGMYKNIEKAYVSGKPVMLYNVTAIVDPDSGDPLVTGPIMVSIAKNDDGKFLCSASVRAIAIAVTSDDAVTVIPA